MIFQSLETKGFPAFLYAGKNIPEGQKVYKIYLSKIKPALFNDLYCIHSPTQTMQRTGNTKWKLKSVCYFNFLSTGPGIFKQLNTSTCIPVCSTIAIKKILSLIFYYHNLSSEVPCRISFSMKQPSAVQKQKYQKESIWLTKLQCSLQYFWEQHSKSTV